MHYDTVYSYYTMTYHHTEPEQGQAKKTGLGYNLLTVLESKDNSNFCKTMYALNGMLM